MFLVPFAADHASRLMDQGLGRDRALDHAVQRFGIPRDAIVAEIEHRHIFDLPEVTEITQEFETMDAARRWIEGGSPAVLAS